MSTYSPLLLITVAPARERGLKLLLQLHLSLHLLAPARERGLKSVNCLPFRCYWTRSREGAWIEISAAFLAAMASFVAPARERGLKSVQTVDVHPAICRSREGAWIEIN